MRLVPANIEALCIPGTDSVSRELYRLDLNAIRGTFGDQNSKLGPM